MSCGLGTIVYSSETSGFSGLCMVPSGKLTVCYGKSPSLIGKSTINGPFSIAMLNYQRVALGKLM